MAVPERRNRSSTSDFRLNQQRITVREALSEEGGRAARRIAQIPSPQSFRPLAWPRSAAQWLWAPASQKPLASPGHDCSPGSRPSGSCSCRLRHDARSPLAFPLHHSAAAARALVSSVCAPCTCRPSNSPFHPSAKPSPTSASTAAPRPPGTPTPPVFPER